MLDISPKGTVPILLLPDGRVLEESLDIMLWSLEQNDPENWLAPDIGSYEEMLALITCCEGEFKPHLDRYKYAPRYENVDPIEHRNTAEIFLKELNTRLLRNINLFGQGASLADMAIAPFVRQFANVDRNWFEQTDYQQLKHWLHEFLDSSRFKSILFKYQPWAEGDPLTHFPKQ